MLVLSRKLREQVVINETITLDVLGITDGGVRLGIIPPRGEPLELAEKEPHNQRGPLKPEIIHQDGEQMVAVSLDRGAGLVINGTTQVLVVESQPGKVRLGIVAPVGVPVSRKEMALDDPPRGESGRGRPVAVSSPIFQDWIARQIKRYFDESPGSTLQGLADKVGVSAATIMRWRSKQTNVANAHLEPLMEALGISLDDLARELNVSEITPPDVKVRGPATSRTRA